MKAHHTSQNCVLILTRILSFQDVPLQNMFYLVSLGHVVFKTPTTSGILSLFDRTSFSPCHFMLEEYFLYPITISLQEYSQIPAIMSRNCPPASRIPIRCFFFIRDRTTQLPFNFFMGTSLGQLVLGEQHAPSAFILMLVEIVRMANSLLLTAVDCDAFCHFSSSTLQNHEIMLSLLKAKD